MNVVVRPFDADHHIGRWARATRQGSFLWRHRIRPPFFHRTLLVHAFDRTFSSELCGFTLDLILFCLPTANVIKLRTTIQSNSIYRMATFMPHFQMPQKPHQDLPSNTPPEQSQFQTNIFPQRVPSLHGSNGRKNQHRISGDYRSNGPVPAGDKAASISTGPQPHIPNGGLRPMHVMGGFEGARSPPNTKSMWQATSVSAR